MAETMTMGDKKEEFKDHRKMRLHFVNWILSQPPSYEPGSRFVYSNFGYGIMGAVLERLYEKENPGNPKPFNQIKQQILDTMVRTPLPAVHHCQQYATVSSTPPSAVHLCQYIHLCQECTAVSTTPPSVLHTPLSVSSCSSAFADVCAQGVIGNYGSRIGRANIELHTLQADVAAAKAATGEDEAANKELKDAAIDKLEKFKKEAERLEEARKIATASGNAARIKEATKALDEFDPLAHDYSDRVMGHDGGSEGQCTKKRGENSDHWIRTLPGM